MATSPNYLAKYAIPTNRLHNVMLHFCHFLRTPKRVSIASWSWSLGVAVLDGILVAVFDRTSSKLAFHRAFHAAQ